GYNNVLGINNTYSGYQAGYNGTTVVNSVTITSGGTGYTAGSLVVDNTDTGGTGFAGTYTVDGSGTIDSITITNNGSGYHTAPTITGVGGSGADLSGVLASADNNTANGYQALYSNTTGYRNSAQGMYSLYFNTTGSYNTAQGYNAGRYIDGGSTANETSNNSLYLGADTKALADGDTNEIVIGNNTTGNGSNTVTLGNDSITDVYMAEDGEAKVHAGQYVLSDLNTAPSSASDTGTKGEIRVTATAIYICTATDTWVKCDLATW
ncbi:MAG: hypothetical protein PHZ27_04355, partial [Candidatus Omnitrophica bacterium]|nr:hypothetical protein [Candidatus Omnitrophota bacterium]